MSAEGRPPLDGTAYEVLGVSPGSDERALKQRYYRIARKWHPDVSKHKDAQAVFARVGHAYQILSDPQQRLVYDFVLTNDLPLGTLDRFQRFYATASRFEFFIRHRHTAAWALVGGVGIAVARMRWASVRQPAEGEAVGGGAGGARSDTPIPPGPTAAVAPAAAMGALIGAGGATSSMLALGAAGPSGAARVGSD